MAFLLSAPHLLPNVESYFYSARGTTDAKFLFDTYLVSPWRLITYIAPDFFGNPATYNYFAKGFYYEQVVYVGIVGLLLGLIAVFSGKKTPEMWFFFLTWIVTLSLGLTLPTSWFLLYYLHLPLISTILPSRIFLLTSFSLATLCGFGWDILQKNKSFKSITISNFIVLFALGAAWIFVLLQRHGNPLSEYARISLHNLVLPTIYALLATSAIILFWFKKVRKISFWFLLFISIISVIYFSTKYLYFSERRFVYPQNPVFTELSKVIGNDRFWSFGKGYIDRNFSTHYLLQSPEGYDSFYIRRYGEFVEATKNKGVYTPNVIRADAQFVSVNKLSEIANNKFLLTALDLLGVSCITAKTSQEDSQFVLDDPSKRFGIAWTDGEYTIFRNTKAFPRTFLVDSYIVTTDPKKTMNYMFDPNTDLHTHVVLDKDPRIVSSDQQIVGSAVIQSYKPEEVKIKVNTDRDAILFLSDNYYPGWNVYVDGKKDDLLRADYTFRGVEVKKGKHDVVFIYQPFSVTLGFVFFGIGALLFVGTGFIMKKRLL